MKWMYQSISSNGKSVSCAKCKKEFNVFTSKDSKKCDECIDEEFRASESRSSNRYQNVIPDGSDWVNP